MSDYEPSSSMVARAAERAVKEERKRREQRRKQKRISDLCKRLDKISFDLNYNENAGAARAIRELCEVVRDIVVREGSN